MRGITVVGAALLVTVLTNPAVQAAQVSTVPQLWEQEQETNWAPATEAFTRIEETDATRVLAALVPPGASVTEVAPGKAGEGALLLRDYGTADYPLYVSGLLEEYIAAGVFPPFARVSVSERQRIIRSARGARLTHGGETAEALLLAVPKASLRALTESQAEWTPDAEASRLQAMPRKALETQLLARVRRTIEMQKATGFTDIIAAAKRHGGLTLRQVREQPNFQSVKLPSLRPLTKTATGVWEQTVVVTEEYTDGRKPCVRMQTRLLTEQDTVWVLWILTKMNRED